MPVCGVYALFSGFTSAPCVLVAASTAIVQGHKQIQIDKLLPWNYAPKL